MAKDNRTLGRFHLVGMPPAPRGMPQIDVTFDIDANGILNVSAKDIGTGKEQNITITGSSGLDESEIEGMVKDAESHAEEDEQRRQKVDAHNRLDQLIYSTEKTLDEHKEKMSTEDRGNIETALEEAKKALEADELAGLEEAITRLTEASHKLAEAVYKAGATEDAAQAAEQQAASGGSTSDEEVIDAEYVDVDEKS